jgi:hypothetical protein
MEGIIHVDAVDATGTPPQVAAVQQQEQQHKLELGAPAAGGSGTQTSSDGKVKKSCRGRNFQMMEWVRTSYEDDLGTGGTGAPQPVACVRRKSSWWADVPSEQQQHHQLESSPEPEEHLLLVPRFQTRCAAPAAAVGEQVILPFYHGLAQLELQRVSGQPNDIA